MPSCFQQKDYKGTFFKHQRAHVERTSDYLYTNENHVDYISSKLKFFCLKYKEKKTEISTEPNMTKPFDNI